MQNISEVIHEVIAVLIFAGAITLLIFFNESSTAANTSVSQSIEKGVNVKESNTGYSGNLTISGASVIFDIESAATDNTGVEITIQNDAEHADNTEALTASPADISKNVTVSASDLSKLRNKEEGYNTIRQGIISHVQMNQSYKKTYLYSKSKNLSGITYTLDH